MCGCSIGCCIVDPRGTVTPDLQPGKSESNMLIDYVKILIRSPPQGVFASLLLESFEVRIVIEEGSGGAPFLYHIVLISS